MSRRLLAVFVLALFVLPFYSCGDDGTGPPVPSTVSVSPSSLAFTYLGETGQLTAQARTSAFYMALAPIAVLAMYYFLLDPGNTTLLFTTVPGQIILCMALILNVIAYVWARAILNPDI